MAVLNFDESEVAESPRRREHRTRVSDAGAHASQLCDACFATHLLADATRRQARLVFSGPRGAAEETLRERAEPQPFLDCPLQQRRVEVLGLRGVRYSGIDALEDLKVVFGSNFYFGCEADDPTNAWAFDTRVSPLGVRLRPILGPDIGH